MKLAKRILGAACALMVTAASHAASLDVRAYGAKGDGHTIDTAAINAAIDAANAAGGGTVIFPPGDYASYSVHLKSNVTLYLSHGAALIAAEPSADGTTGYDLPEPNANDPYEDFGHSHWHNSLIWGENLVNVAITGPGTIYGRGLSRGLAPWARDLLPDERDKGLTLPEAAGSPHNITTGPFGYPSNHDTMAPHVGNKAIALRNCRNVILRDFTIYHGGHFGILAMATDNLTLDNLTIDTNRDGMDIDCCVNVRVSNCSVNSPFDDGICLKSCYALGTKRATENVTITNCAVSGYKEGTLIDGTRVHLYQGDEVSGGTGRIKFGTESNGGFKNISISNCTFDYCRGLALEIVDGGVLENVTISNLAMRDIGNSAIYVRLGERNREPHTPNGVVRRVSISHVVAQGVDPRFSSIIEGSADAPIEDLTLSDIHISYKGGGTAADAAIVPKEDPKAYPEPHSHGIMPAYGLFARHVRGLYLRDVDVSYASTDLRPAFSFWDVKDLELRTVHAAHEPQVPVMTLHDVSTVSSKDVRGLGDFTQDHVAAAAY
jgi:polygalacturonase